MKILLKVDTFIFSKRAYGIPGVESGFEVRQFEGVAHGLDMAGGGARLRAEQPRHARLQSLAD